MTIAALGVSYRLREIPEYGQDFHMSSSSSQDIVDWGFSAGRVVAVDVLDGAGSSKGEPVRGDTNNMLLDQFFVKTFNM